MLSGSIHQSVDVLSEVMKNAGIPLPRTSKEAVPSLLAARKAIEERGLSTHLQLELPVKNEDRDYMDICWAAGISFGMIDYVRGADLHARGLLRALQVGEPARLARALGLQSMYASANGRDELDATLAIANRSLHLAETLDNPHTLGLAHYGRGVDSCSMVNGPMRKRRSNILRVSSERAARMPSGSGRPPTPCSFQPWPCGAISPPLESGTRPPRVG